MGCCASSNQKPVSGTKQHRHSSSAGSDASRRHKSVPTPEEETVKEVLSETPTPTPKPPIAKIEAEENKRGSRLAPLHKVHEQNRDNVDGKALMETSVVSEVSDICSLSESVSTVTEVREDEDGEVRQRVDRSRTPFRNRAFHGDRSENRTTVGKSPARRSEPSPGRVRSMTGRERQRRAVLADGQNRDLGESSGRRSRSPAIRSAETGAANAGLGRSSSARKTGKSPGRARSEVAEKTRKLEEVNNEMCKWPPPTANESLENPLVSLECFIFL